MSKFEETVEYDTVYTAYVTWKKPEDGGVAYREIGSYLTYAEALEALIPYIRKKSEELRTSTENSNAVHADYRIEPRYVSGLSELVRMRRMKETKE